MGYNGIFPHFMGYDVTVTQLHMIYDNPIGTYVLCSASCHLAPGLTRSGGRIRNATLDAASC